MRRSEILFTSLALVLGVGCSSTGGGSSGAFVEARTASVFAGACHYGSEYTTAGREAVLAWRFDEGAAKGAEVVAVVASDKNLDEAAPDRRSVVFVDGPEDARKAAMDVLRSMGILGEVVSIEVGAEVCVEGERYRVVGGAGVEVSGALLADRACCSMPSKVWYEPLAGCTERVVGNSAVFQCEVQELGLRFERTGENDAFVGSFTW